MSDSSMLDLFFLPTSQPELQAYDSGWIFFFKARSSTGLPKICWDIIHHCLSIIQNRVARVRNAMLALSYRDCRLPALTTILLLAKVKAQGQCFLPDGTVAYGDVPCGSSSPAQCCSSIGGICLSNGLCFNPSVNLISRSSCTDQTWAASVCTTICKTSELVVLGDCNKFTDNPISKPERLWDCTQLRSWALLLPTSCRLCTRFMLLQFRWNIFSPSWKFNRCHSE